MAPHQLPRPQPNDWESLDPLGSHRSTPWPKVLALIRNLLREPLLHFLLVGALIFAVYELLDPAANRTDQANRIVLTKDDLRQPGRPVPFGDHELVTGREAIEGLPE